MKIDNATKPASIQTAKDPRIQTAKKSNPSAESVQLSKLSAQLMASESTASFDKSRVAEIKQAISEGRFTINAGAIADRLIESAQELVNSR